MSLHVQQHNPLSVSDLELIKGWVLQAAIVFLLYGIYITLSVCAMFVFFSQGLQGSAAKRGLFALTIFMLLTSSASSMLHMEHTLLGVSSLGVNSTDTHSVSNIISIVLLFTDQVNYLISDFIVVWRAWIMYPRSFIARTVLGICIIGSCAGIFVDTGIAIVETIRGIDFLEASPRLLICIIPIFFTNLVSTILMGYKAWRHHCDLRKNLTMSSSSVGRVQKILFLLFESGLIYCLVWISYLVISEAGTENTISFTIFFAAMPHTSALYPVMIIIIVSLENSQDLTENPSLSQSIRFASGHVVETEPLINSVELSRDVSKEETARLKV